LDLGRLYSEYFDWQVGRDTIWDVTCKDCISLNAHTDNRYQPSRLSLLWLPPAYASTTVQNPQAYQIGWQRFLNAGVLTTIEGMAELAIGIAPPDDWY